MRPEGVLYAFRGVRSLDNTGSKTSDSGQTINMSSAPQNGVLNAYRRHLKRTDEAIFRAGIKQRLEELEEFLDEHQEPVTDYDEGMARRLIERITVFEDHLEFEFKCGLETEVQM